MYKSGRQLGIWKGTSHLILSFALSLPENYHLIPSPVLSYPTVCRWLFSSAGRRLGQFKVSADLRSSSQTPASMRDAGSCWTWLAGVHFAVRLSGSI